MSESGSTEDVAVSVDDQTVSLDIEKEDPIVQTSKSSSSEDVAPPVEDNETSSRLGTGTSNSRPTHLTSHGEHEMTLKVGNLSPYECSGCKESGIGDRFICDVKGCPYILHPDCRSHVEEATHEFLKGSTFRFFEEHSNTENRSCVACGQDIKGYFYHCDATKKSAHPCCLSLKNTIRVGSMKFLLCEKLTSPCFYCNQNENMLGKSWCYSTKRKDSQVHVSCMKDMIHSCLKKNTTVETGCYEKTKILLNMMIEFLKLFSAYLKQLDKVLKPVKKLLGFNSSCRQEGCCNCC
ncbi:hypothetical protein E3N88_10659 [Mikania micrantha]|uniref:DC1 domain-containing protein n=1 Tax=Mikania micrantha TaxID=192012 RepID=A0A5N6PC76_9ASTR|nr:hypothetical protein E3N88_10659 [Mikania micrantha]